jgi:hypothetical protein
MDLNSWRRREEGRGEVEVNKRTIVLRALPFVVLVVVPVAKYWLMGLFIGQPM